jgi:microcystin-dependent protein
MTDQFIGEIRTFGFNFAPVGWAACDGQILPISQNTALFSLLGTSYGGDGVTTFALPNLQGIVALHIGQGSGLTPYLIGESVGSTAVTLTQQQIGAHSHTLQARTGRGTQTTAIPAAGDALATSGDGAAYSSAAPNVTMSPSELTVTGGSLPHNNVMPLLGFTICIALVGIFPARG